MQRNKMERVRARSSENTRQKYKHYVQNQGY